MSNLVSLKQVKSHLRINHNDEDALLAVYIAAAEQSIVNFLNQPIPGISASPPTPAPYPVLAAALLTIGDLYENREGAIITKTSSTAVAQNPAVVNLLYPYRCDIGF